MCPRRFTIGDTSPNLPDEFFSALQLRERGEYVKALFYLWVLYYRGNENEKKLEEIGLCGDGAHAECYLEFINTLKLLSKEQIFNSSYFKYLKKEVSKDPNYKDEFIFFVKEIKKIKSNNFLKKLFPFLKK